VINGADVKAGGALATEVDSGGTVFAGSVAASHGAWTVRFRIGGQTPVSVDGTVVGPGPVVDATIEAVGLPIELHGTPGKDLSVSVGKRETHTLAFSRAGATTRPLAAASIQDAAAGLGLDWLRTFVAFTVAGLLLLLIAPGLRDRGLTATHSSPLSRLVVGALVALDVPLASLLLMVVGLPFGLWWLGLLGFVAFIAIAVAGYAFSGFVIGLLLLSLAGLKGLAWPIVLSAGVALLALASLVPYVGGIISLLAVIYGMGSMLYAPRRAAPTTLPETALDRRALDTPASASRPLVE
jgi:hypothetical protein